jgi:hypothetical protein
MAKGLLYHLCSFEMTLHRGDDREKGISKSLKVGDILSNTSRPHNMLVLPNLRHPEKIGDHRAHLEI